MCNSMAPVLASSLCFGIALVLQGCGSSSITKTCTVDGQTITFTASCNGGDYEFEGSGTMDDATCKQVPSTSTTQGGMNIEMGCSNGKYTYKMTVPLNGATCNDDLLKQSLDSFTCPTAASSANTLASTETKLFVVDDAKIKDINSNVNMMAHKIGAKDIAENTPPKAIREMKAHVNMIAEAFGSTKTVANTPTGSTFTEKITYMAIGGLVVGLAFLAHRTIAVRVHQAREPAVEMAPPSTAA